MQRIAASEIIEKDTPFVPEYPRRSLRNDHAAHFGILTPFGRNLHPQEKLSREIDIILRRYGHKPKYKKVVFYAKEKPKPITGTIVTSDHELEVPNRLQEKIYNGFQGIKQLSEQNDFKQIDQAAQILLGQVQAAKSIDNKKFPEIERLTKEIRNIQEPQRDFKPKPPHRRKAKGKIHISKPRTN